MGYSLQEPRACWQAGQLLQDRGTEQPSFPNPTVTRKAVSLQPALGKISQSKSLPNRTTLTTTHLRPFLELCGQTSRGLLAARDWPGVRQTGEGPGSIFFSLLILGSAPSSCSVILLCLIQGRALQKIPILLHFSWSLMAVPPFLEWVQVAPWTPS